MTPIGVSFGVAITLGGLLLAGTLRNPGCLPFASMFLVAAFGIRRHKLWSAFGGALLIAASVATATITLLRNRTIEVPWASLAIVWLILLTLAWLLYRAGRAMRGSGPVGSRAAWISLAAVVFLFPQALQPYVVASDSMENTLAPGDYMLVRPIAGAAISRGDVIQMRYPIGSRQTWVKRIQQWAATDCASATRP